MSKEATVIDEVAAERHRQIEHEGWTTGHDDEHSAGELAHAAACYILGSTCEQQVHIKGRVWRTARLWPWELEWWKPTNRRRDLIKAAALIIAEIERFDRAQ